MSLRLRTLPAGFIEPCLPTSSKPPPAGDGWTGADRHNQRGCEPGRTLFMCGASPGRTSAPTSRSACRPYASSKNEPASRPAGFGVHGGAVVAPIDSQYTNRSRQPWPRMCPSVTGSKVSFRVLAMGPLHRSIQWRWNGRRASVARYHHDGLTGRGGWPAGPLGLGQEYASQRHRCDHRAE